MVKEIDFIKEDDGEISIYINQRKKVASFKDMKSAGIFAETHIFSEDENGNIIAKGII